MEMKTRAGFTLLELLVVITIIGILSAVGIMSLPRDKIQVREASRIISADILRARSEAIRLNTRVELAFNVTNDSYILNCSEDRDCDGEPDSSDVATVPTNILERRLGSEFPLADLSAASFISGASIWFDVRGLPNGAGSVTVASKGRSSYALQVLMAAQGRVRVE